MERKRPTKYKEKLSVSDKMILKVLLKYNTLTLREIIEKFSEIDKTYKNHSYKKTTYANAVRLKGGNRAVLLQQEFIKQDTPTTYSLTKNKGLFTAIMLSYIDKDKVLTSELTNYLIETYRINETFENYWNLCDTNMPYDEIIENVSEITNNIINDTVNFYKKTNNDFNNEFLIRTFFKYNEIDANALIEAYKKMRDDVRSDIICNMDLDRIRGK